MSIRTQAGQGIFLGIAASSPSLQTDRIVGGYYKVRLTQGGDEFFSHENSQLILQYLGEFLPRAVERTAADGSVEVFYQFLHDGQDVCGDSAQLKKSEALPANEVSRLNAAIAAMKAKEDDPATDPTKRLAISGFRLPSPHKDPELYRVCTIGGKKRLLVLWGVEKEPGSSIIPQEAASTVAAAGSKPSKGIPALVWLLLLLLLIAGGVYSYSKFGSQPTVTNDPTKKPIADPRAHTAGQVDPTTGQPTGGVDPTTGPTTGPPTAGANPTAGPLTAGVDPTTGQPIVPVERVKATDSGSDLVVIAGPTALPIDPKQTPQSPRPAKPNEIGLAKLIRPAVVTIAVGTKEEGYQGHGTGFLISSNGLVVTSAHVLNGMDRLVAITAEGQTLAVTKVLEADGARDLALLTLDTQKAALPFLRLGEPKSAEVGGNIAVMGTPQGLSSTFTTGIVSAMREEKSVDKVQFTAPVSPGSSGSPVVDEKARVVGTVQGGIDMTVAQALNFAIDVGELHELLAELGARGEKTAAAAFEQDKKEVASNEKKPGDIPDGAESPKPPSLLVTWAPEKMLPPATAPATETPPKSIDDQPIRVTAGRVQVREVSRKPTTDGVEILLQVLLLSPSGATEEIIGMRCESSGTALDVAKDQVRMVAAKGVNQLKISGKDAKGAPVAADVEIDVAVEIKTGVDIKVK